MDSPMDGEHKCSVCGSTFTAYIRLVRHMRSHTEDIPYKCVHCDDQFSRRDFLLRHIQKYHSGDKEHPHQSTTYRLDPLTPNLAGGSMDGPPVATQSQNKSNPREGPNGEGVEFSSALGLMSLEDTVVFVDNQPQRLPEALHQDAQQASNEPFAPGIMGYTNQDQSHDNAQTPNAKEQESRTAREMWSAFLHDRTTRLKADAAEMGQPKSPTPPFQQSPHPPQHLHRRSRSRSSGVNPLRENMGQPTNRYPQVANQQQVHRPKPPEEWKSPQMPTAQHTLYEGKIVIKKLENQASKVDNEKPMAGVGLATLSDSLGGYEEAILARKAPVLKLPVKLTTRDLTASANTDSGGTGSILFPSISQSARASGAGSIVADSSIQRKQQPPTNLDGLNATRLQNNQRVQGSPSGIAGHFRFPAQVGRTSSPNRSRTTAPPSNHVNATSLSQALALVTKKMFRGTRNVPSQQSPTFSTSSSQNKSTAAAKTSATSLVSKGVSGAVDGALTHANDWYRGRRKHKRKRQDKYNLTVRPHGTESSDGHADIAEDGNDGSGSGSTEWTYSESRSSFSSRDARQSFGRQNSRASSFSSRAGNYSVVTDNTGGNTNSAHGSRSSSRLGTASSQGGGGTALSSYHLYISARSTPHRHPSAHSLPSSRLSTSSAPSPSRSFAFAPPSHSVQAQSDATFQPGSLPSDSMLLSPTSSNPTSTLHRRVTTLSFAGILSTPSPNSRRPNYMRLASQVLEPSHSKQTQPYATFQPGSLPSDSMSLSPTSANPTSTSPQLATTPSFTEILNSISSSHGRPNHKRPASQVLEPFPSKRPPLRRGDANFSSTLKDQESDGAVDMFESEGVTGVGGSERVYGLDPRTNGKGAGTLGPKQCGMNASARRMSEPAVSARMMMMGMPGGSGGGD